MPSYWAAARMGLATWRSCRGEKRRLMTLSPMFGATPGKAAACRRASASCPAIG